MPPNNTATTETPLKEGTGAKPTRPEHERTTNSIEAPRNNAEENRETAQAEKTTATTDSTTTTQWAPERQD